ncbi:MAG TPA: bifunctional adenosylcobinamide kinase/adenosylcobinamide-phosphate guanylyltransferase [Chloroflexota bacterium]|nr:bifunctional adenosylcobinamide kinase/adenosylcobinamide-phosphate guanylyltransferase [Chloroflexota bacterium]
MGRTILVTGGRRSGTREVAEQVARSLGVRVFRILTADDPADASWPTRPLGMHWRTTTAPRNLLTALPRESRETAVLIDCLTVWAGNRLVALGDPSGTDWDTRVKSLTTQLVDEVSRVIRRARQGKWSLVLVLNEIDGESAGAEHLGQAYRLLVEELDESVRAAVDGVYAVVGGLPYEVKQTRRLQTV